MTFPHPVLITGVGRAGQVGESVARELAQRGARLLLVDRTLANAEARAGELRDAGHEAEAFAADLSDPTQVDALARSIRSATGGRLSAAVLAAGGFAMSGAVAESDLGIWERMHAINLTTALLATRAAIPLLRPDGALVYFASAAVLPGSQGARTAAYAAAKAGVLALMRAVAEEERANGVRANALAPTAIRTAANLESMGETGRYVEREEVARVVAWLCGAEGKPITGQVIGL